jgi:antitoxin component YwqK of YwqJK toxin-antitoxin module
MKNGLETMWHENGQKWREGTYKDGKLNGLATSRGTYNGSREILEQQRRRG